MAEKMNKILHKRSVQPNELGNGPKLPDASILEYGEVAVNYGAGHEALSFKNNNDEVVSLRTDEYYQGKFNDVIGDIEATEARITDITTAIEENEEVLASAITDLDSRIKTIEENGSGCFDEESVRGIVNSVVNTVITDLDSSAESTNGSFVNVKVEQADGLISNVTVFEQNIVSTSDLETEKNARISGDTALQSNIDDEAGLREAGDAALQGKIDVLNGTGEGSVDKKINDAFNDFATKLSDDNVVNTYKELIDYAATHGAEFTELVGTVTDMDAAYKAADEQLQANITAEENTRKSEITRVEGLVSAEATTRGQEIARVEGLVSTEATTRGQEIARVEGLVSTEKERAEAAEQGLQTNIDNLDAAVVKSVIVKRMVAGVETTETYSPVNNVLDLSALVIDAGTY